MTLFRSSSVHETLLTSQNARRPMWPAGARPSTTHAAAVPLTRPANNKEEYAPAPESEYSQDPTYYDVLKCRGEFATASAFFGRPVKAAHSSASTYPWATQPAALTAPGADSGTKHRLRRSVNGTSVDASSVASSVFGTHVDNALPPSVFRLPGSGTRRGKDHWDSDGLSGVEDPWALRGMTAGGRALRKADQLILSPFDRKVTLA